MISLIQILYGSFSPFHGICRLFFSRFHFINLLLKEEKNLSCFLFFIPKSECFCPSKLRGIFQSPKMVQIGLKKFMPIPLTIIEFYAKLVRERFRTKLTKTSYNEKSRPGQPDFRKNGNTKSGRFGNSRNNV